MRAIDEEEARAQRRYRESFENDSGYQFVQGQSPQTLGYALTDSPIGQAAWLYEKYDRWTDHEGDLESLLTRDEILDNISLYWLTGSAASSARIYWENQRSLPLAPVTVPLGYTQFPQDTYLASRRWVAERYPTLAYYNQAQRGGHFPAWEQPALFAAEVRRSFRQSL